MIALIRTDGSFKIGIGHVTRCMALAEGLRQTGIKSLFIIKGHDKNVIRFIRDKGYGLKIISRKSSARQEIAFFNRCIKKYKPRFLITDSYYIDNEYLEKVDAGESVLVSIDGLIRKDLCSDIVINQNTGVGERDYKDLVKKGTSLLLGPKYFLLRKEFRAIKRNSRRIKTKVKSILICMGGADPVNATLKIAEALAGHLNGIELKIIFGAAYKHVCALKETVSKKLEGQVELYFNPSNFADIVFSSDIVICAGGVTRMETLYLGIPAIVIIIADNQATGADILAKKGIIINLGKYSQISKNKICENVYKLSCNKDRRKDMSFKAKKLIDGKGVSRIIKEMELVCEKNKNRQ